MRAIRSSKPSTGSTGSILSTPLAIRLTGFSAKPLCVALCVTALLLSFGTGIAGAQDSHHARDYTSIVVFGDSLSDTGNVAHLTVAKYGVQVPGPDADYTAGRFTDGADTLPPAEKYFGVWVEQLAASFPSKPAVKDSLDGGTNYAYGFATTGDGTGAF